MIHVTYEQCPGRGGRPLTGRADLGADPLNLEAVLTFSGQNSAQRHDSKRSAGWPAGWMSGRA